MHNQERAALLVPGLPWYPAFAAFPSPVAPPMPNMPTPLMGIVLPGLAMVQDSLVKNESSLKYISPEPSCGDDVAAAVGMA